MVFKSSQSTILFSLVSLIILAGAGLAERADLSNDVGVDVDSILCESVDRKGKQREKVDLTSSIKPPNFFRLQDRPCYYGWNDLWFREHRAYLVHQRLQVERLVGFTAPNCFSA